MEKKISVVIPTYQRPTLLARCLCALQEQTLHKNYFYVIVVSDGYDALSETVVANFAPLFNGNMRYLHTDVHKGPAAARNLGWLAASAKLIAFTDDDCIPDKHWLEEIIKAYKQEQQIVYTGKVVVPIGEIPTDYEKNIAQLQEAEFITANCACTKEALYAAGGFDERYRMAWREDSDLHFNFLSNEVPIKHLLKAIIIHPVRKAKWGISLREQKKGVYNALLFKKFPNLYRSRIQQKTPIVYYAMLLLILLIIVFTVERQKQLLSHAVLLWSSLTAWFIFKRLHGTSKSLAHVFEMILTSLLIPYIAIYWHWYGALKFKVFVIY